MSELPTFELPSMPHNTAGWGPVGFVKELEDSLYAPFYKGDRLTRIADWNPHRGKIDKGYHYQQQGANTNFSFQQSEDASAFQLVDNRPKVKPAFNYRGGPGAGGANRGRRPQGGQQYQHQQQGQQQGYQRLGRPGQQQQGYQQRSYQQRRNMDKPQRLREPSVDIQPEWKLKEDIEFSRLSKLVFEPDSESTIRECGAVFSYDRAYDKVSPRQEVMLKPFERVKATVTTSDDPVIQQLAQNNEARVFGIDSLIAVIMAAPRSVFPWDIIVNRIDDKLYFDKRQGTPKVDFLTVNENGDFDDKEGVMDTLSVEATYINLNYGQQVLNTKVPAHQFEHPSPFAKAANADNLVPVAYRYRKFEMGDYSMIVRTEIDGVLTSETEPEKFLTIRCLNEYDSKSADNWRKSLESHKGRIITAEYRNNSNKLARWTLEAILAETDLMKLGFVSRSKDKESKHAILGSMQFSTETIASQLSLAVENSWGIIKALSDLLLTYPVGQYVLLKDPNKPILHIYQTSA